LIEINEQNSISPFDLAKNSSIGVGGYAEIAYMPQTQEELVKLVHGLKKQGKPYFVLGNMTNVLPADGKSKRAFILTKRLNAIDGNYFEAGVTAGQFLKYCKAQNVSGGEFLAGIPCTIGGALYMNAGVAGAYIGDIVESVRVLQDGKLHTLKKEDCAYAYKTSVFMHTDTVILGATLRLQKADKTAIEEKLTYYNERRKHLPKGKSMGCVFKNPENLVAGKLIEGAGLKGLRVGGAYISESHANFIINDACATSAHVRSLIEIIKNAVFAQYKIRLQEEINYLE
jgi:UDP-N-acetylmuramate dehydrogenase